MTRILTGDDVMRVLTLDDCIHAVEEGFRAYAEKRVGRPQSLGLHVDDGSFHIKAAIAAPVFAAKINANFPSNPNRLGLPTIQGVIAVMGTEDGTLLGVMDSMEITTLRTAAATAVAVRYLSREQSTVATIIGCGVQGGAQLEALTRVRPIRRAMAIDANHEIANHFADRMSRRLSISVDVSDDVATAVAQSDIVITCTPSRKPLLSKEHLHDGIFIAGVGADNPDKHELLPALMAASKVVVDVLDQACTMGDLHHAIDAGVMTRDDVYGELGAIVSGATAARTKDSEIFVFDSTGAALQDVAVAAVTLQRAIERGIGTECNLRRHS